VNIVPNRLDTAQPMFCQQTDESSNFPLAEHRSALSPSGRSHLNIDEENAKSGLAKLVLTLIRLLHELLEKQAIRRIEAGSLAEDEIEQLGLTLMKQAQEIQRMCEHFNFKQEDLNLDLGPLGNLI